MKLFELIKSVIVLTLISVCAVQAQATPATIPYYGEEFYRDLRAGVSNKDLQSRLKTVLRNYHIARPGQLDLIVKSCQAGQGTCYAHNPIGYDAARVFLLGDFYLVKNGNGYAVHDVYCDRDKTSNEFRSKLPSPGRIPDNSVINVEHTWPQSHFTKKFPKEVQKSDLHHLFPTDSQVNAVRGNNPFGEVTRDLMNLKCPASRFGIGTAGSDEVFEPPHAHKGNVARALFYFSIRYDLPIDQREEVVLRKWNAEDPVDAEEMQRNDEIFAVQGNRNPFVDFPELVSRIADF